MAVQQRVNYPAGEGEHLFIDLKNESVFPDDGISFNRDEHYLSIEVSRFYLNTQSNIFKSKMASGTVNIKIGSDAEFKVALGNYQLRKGAKSSTKRGDIILPKKVYKGGTLEMNVYLQGIANDTLFANILKEMGTASLGVVSGMIDTATVAGPSKALVAAGDSLVNNVEKILSDKAVKKLNFFDPNGQELNIRLDELAGKENYRLLHRTKWKTEWTSFDMNKYNVVKDNNGNIFPVYDSKEIQDGAWILFRILRFDKYGQERPWKKKIAKPRTDLNRLFREWKIDDGGDGPARDDIKSAIASRKKDNIRKQLLDISTLIENDSGVLSSNEREEFADNVAEILSLARKSEKAGDPQIYLAGIRKIRF